MAKKRFSVEINYRRCKGCKICHYSCPAKENVFDITPLGKVIVAREENCIGCYSCVQRCPDFAIEVKEKKEGG